MRTNAACWIVGLVALGTVNAAMSQTATFDAYPEGTSVPEFVEAGIRFFEYDNRSEPPPSMMVADRADGMLSGQPGFTAPNVLAFGGYAPGNTAAFGQFGSMHMEPTSGRASVAIVNVYDFGNLHNGRTLTLEAAFNGQVVASDTITLSTGGFVRHNELSVSGAQFDELILYAGPSGDDKVYIALDTITVRSGELALDPPSPGMAGVINTLSAHGAAPGSRVFFVYGWRPGSTALPGCPGIFIDIAGPTLAGSDVANANGQAELISFVPDAARNRRIYLQAVEREPCEKSNLLDFVFR